MEVLSDKKIDPVTRADLDFINDDGIDYYDDVDFYCKTRKKLLLDEVPAVKHNVRKLRLYPTARASTGKRMKKSLQFLILST